MNPIADYKVEAIARLIEPDFRRKVSPQEVRNALDGLRRGGTATIDELAAAWGIVRGTVSNRLCQAGVHPVKRKNRKACYAWCDIWRAFPERMADGIEEAGKEASPGI